MSASFVAPTREPVGSPLAIWRILPLFVALTCFTGQSTANLAFAADEKTKEGEEEPEPPPEPEDLELETTDHVTLGLRYFAGTNGEDSVPIIIVHHWKGQGADYEDFALLLQSKGHAVAVPDLRGHGRSTVMKSDDGEKTKALNPDRFKSADVRNMVFFDLEAVKQFLVKENNDRKLNIEKLCLVGIEDGSLIAMNYAVWDWHWEELIGFKNGRDVRAVVMISPTLSRPGLTIETALNHKDVRSRLSMLIVVGDAEKRSLQNAVKINGRLSKYHALPAGADPKLQSLFFIKKQTNLQGFKLLTQEQLETEATVAAFVKLRLADKKVEWAERRRP